MQEVKRLRQAKGWNQNELAFYAGLAPSVISQIENGKRNPAARTLEKLATALEVDVGDLFPKAQAPLPFAEVDEEQQWRSSFMEGWTRYLYRWAEAQERVHEEDGAAMVRRAFAEGPDFIEGALSMRLEVVLTESAETLEGFIEAWRQHLRLAEAGDLPVMSLSQMAEIKNAHQAIIRATKKWLATTRAVLDAAPEEVEHRMLARLVAKSERAIEGHQKVVALFEERLTA